VRLDQNLSIFVFDGLLLSMLCLLSIESWLHLLLVVMGVRSYLVLVYAILELRVGCLSTDVIIQSDVLAGFYFVNSIVV
jgi:hypothetical protein